MLRNLGVGFRRNMRVGNTNMTVRVAVNNAASKRRTFREMNLQIQIGKSVFGAFIIFCYRKARAFIDHYRYTGMALR